MTIDTVQHKFAYTNGIRMHYVEAGTGPLVLLCHGWPDPGIRGVIRFPRWQRPVFV